MRRSFIDRRIEAMLELCDRHQFRLPPFAFWGAAQFRAQPASARRIRQAGLGWNVVEFEPGAFDAQGLSVFTCAWAIGAASPPARGGSMPRRR